MPETAGAGVLAGSAGEGDTQGQASLLGALASGWEGPDAILQDEGTGRALAVEQLAVMRAGYTPLDRLPLDVRAEVEEMLASSPVIGPHH